MAVTRTLADDRRRRESLGAAERFVSLSRPERRPYWFDEAYDVPVSPMRLTGDHAADVCIVGGGYVGLWTAIRVRELEPSRRVMLLESDYCGRAASGRNGGLALSWWMKIPTLVKRFGYTGGVRIARQSVAAIGEVELMSKAEGFDAHFAQEGYVYAATCPAQVGSWGRAAALMNQAGEGEVLEPLSQDEISERFGTRGYLSGVRETCAANLQPAILVRALQARALRLGVEIYERSPMRRLDRAHGVVYTDDGVVHARAIVLALNSWLNQASGLRRSVLPLGSYLCVTEPVPELLRELGWTSRQGINGMAMMEGGVDRTHDGRIKFSYRSGKLSFAGRIGPSFCYDHDSTVRAVANLHRLFPALRHARVTHAWGGVVDRSADGLPFHGQLPGGVRIVYATGFSGNGVAPAVLSGRILASSVLDRDDEWRAHPLNGGPVGRRFPPEPVRFLGGSLVRGAVRRKDAAEADCRRAPPLTGRLARLAPPGFR
jgi:glycine/D-amino acid oxidase-like deaminating enzyme